MATTVDVSALVQRVRALFKRIWTVVGKRISNTEKLYFAARVMLGEDTSPKDLVDDEVGCAESVSQVIRDVVPFGIIPGTWTLNEAFKTDRRFVQIFGAPLRGTIIISPTGTGNGKIRGHVGILSDRGHIMAADSRDGLWKENYTLNLWRARYERLGGFPVYFYVLI